MSDPTPDPLLPLARDDGSPLPICVRCGATDLGWSSDASAAVMTAVCARCGTVMTHQAGVLVAVRHTDPADPDAIDG